MDAHTLTKLTCASALRGLTDRFSHLLGTGPYACRISITPTFVQLMPYALTLHSITVRGAGNDVWTRIASETGPVSCCNETRQREVGLSLVPDKMVVWSLSLKM